MTYQGLAVLLRCRVKEAVPLLGIYRAVLNDVLVRMHLRYIPCETYGYLKPSLRLAQASSIADVSSAGSQLIGKFVRVARVCLRQTTCRYYLNVGCGVNESGQWHIVREGALYM